MSSRAGAAWCAKRTSRRIEHGRGDAMKMTLAAAVPRHSDCDRASSLALMLRSRALSASTRVFDALWRGVSKHEGHGPPHPSRRRLRRLLRMKAEVEPRRSGQNLCAAILVGLTAIATAQTSAAGMLDILYKPDEK